MTEATLKFLPFDALHVERLFAYRQDPVTRAHNPLEPLEIGALTERLSKAASDWSRWDEAEAFFWLIEFDGEIAGNLSLQNINRRMLTAEIGYGIFAEHRGRGIATRALSCLVREAFAQTPLRKLIGLVHSENHASRSVMKNVGFREEGLLREHFLINGNPADEVAFGILATDLRSR